jgi:PadR family transcriptional regulator PadR
MTSMSDSTDQPTRRRLLTTQEALIVNRLLPQTGSAEGPPWRYGQELARATGLPTGTVHPILARLMAWGWLEDEWRQGQHHYRLTDDGAAEAQAALVRLQAPSPPADPGSRAREQGQ